MSSQKQEAASEALAPRQRTEVVAFNPDDPRALYMNTGLFDQLQRVASLMSKANVVPEHLRGEGKLADCFLVVSQAFRWGMDPFAVAQCTYVLKGKLGYEGKLIAAVVNVSGRLTAPLSYTYTGSGKERRVVVAGQFRSESEPRVVDGTVGQWATGNEQWTKAPDQMLAYRGAREWARRHMPEAIVGVQAEEEVDFVDVTPRPALEPGKPLMEAAKERLRASAPEPPEEKPNLAAGEACFHREVWSWAEKLPAGKTVLCPTCKKDLGASAILEARHAAGE